MIEKEFSFKKKNLIYSTSVKKMITLVEMIVVVTIVSIISAVGVFSTTLIASRRLQQEVSLIRADLGWVREMAVSKNSDFCVRFLDAHTYQIFEGDCSSTGNFMKEVRLRSSIVNPSPPFDITFYTFDSARPTPGGVAYSASSSGGELVITLQQQTRTRNLRIFEETGFITIE